MAPPEKKDVTVFPTQIVMLQTVSYVCEDSLKINAFREDGKPCYEGKSPSGHIWWDICNYAECGKPLSCYMFDHASPSYSQDFPPLESFEHP